MTQRSPGQPDSFALLVARLREKGPDAAQLLETQYRERLLKFCWGYLGDHEEAEDAVQEICFKVLQVGQVPDGFRPWLFRIARNQCLNMVRARARRVDRQHLPTGSLWDAATTGQLTVLMRHETEAELRRAVDGLPEDQREALRLRYVENLSRAEIAEILEVSESVVKSRLFEGLQTLRQIAAQKKNS